MAYQHSRQSDAQPVSSRRSGALSLQPRGINFCGYLRTESGVGAAARAYVRALEKTGLPLALLDISDLQTNRSQDDSFRRFDVEHPFDVNLICADIELHYAIASRFGESLFRD